MKCCWLLAICFFWQYYILCYFLHYLSLLSLYHGIVFLEEYILLYIYHTKVFSLEYVRNILMPSWVLISFFFFSQVCCIEHVDESCWGRYTSSSEAPNNNFGVRKGIYCNYECPLCTAHSILGIVKLHF